MIRTLTNVLKQDKEKFAVPRKVQDIIPVRSIWPDGIFLTGKNKFSKSFIILLTFITVVITSSIELASFGKPLKIKTYYLHILCGN